MDRLFVYWGLIMNRDFKGVWIPKEVWLNEELTMLEKVIFVEIDSLDNENHCTAGNEYFAEFCNCSESKVSKAIKKLKELSMIEELSFDGRHRKIRVVKSTKQGSKKYEAESQNLQSNNISNNTNKEKKVVSKDTTTEFPFGKSKPKKESLFNQCVSLIDDFISKHNCSNPVRRKLISYLTYRLSVKEKPLYANMWKGMLNKLAELGGDDIRTYEAIIAQSIERGYLSFYPLSNFGNSDVRKGKAWEEGISCDTYTEEEKRQIEKEREEMIARGERVWY